MKRFLSVFLLLFLVTVTYAQREDVVKKRKTQPTQTQSKKTIPSKSKPETPETWYKKGDLYCRQQNYPEALKWWRKAADQGHAKAQTGIGFLYQWGYGIQKDGAEAERWYRKAAEQGDMEAQYRLGDMYDYGREVEKNYVEAVKWYLKAGEQGESWALYHLGRIYEIGGYGIQKDLDEAITWYQKAADKENSSAISALKRLNKLP